MNRTLGGVILVSFALLNPGTSRADSVKARSIELKFVPQETLSSSSPTLGEGVISRPVRLMFEDKRPASEVLFVGQGTDDGDRAFPWQPTSPAFEFTKDVFVRTAQSWGVRFNDKADLTLMVRLNRFFVDEKDQAVGSNYSADVRLTYELTARDSKIMNSGAASGSARRYGRSRSADNCNEVLSDAMKEAYANLYGQPGLQDAWSGKKAEPEEKVQPKPPRVLLSEVVGLKREGFTTEMIIRYINQQVLSTPLSAQDMLDWKEAGLPESVIEAAMNRSSPQK